MNDSGLTEATPRPPASPGELLGECRMEMGLTVEEVAVSLKLDADVIEELEAGDYSRLAGPTYDKGYMRSYARLLHLDEDDLVGRAELEPEPALITGIGSGKETTGRRIRFRPRPRPRAWRRKSGNSALRRVLVLLVLGGLVAGGLTLLPRFGFDRISDLVPIDRIASRWFAPGDWAGDRERNGEPAGALTRPGDSGDSTEQPAGALIRLE